MMQASKTPYSATLVGIDEDLHLGASLFGMDQQKVDQFKNSRLGGVRASHPDDYATPSTV